MKAVVVSSDDALADELAAGGVTLGEDTGADLDLLVIEPVGQPPSGPDHWAPLAVDLAMDVVGDVIDGLLSGHQRLRPGGLAVVVVREPAERCHLRQGGDGMVSAALAMAVQVLAADWAPEARCLLVVTGETGRHRLADTLRWLAAPDAAPLTGQTVDLAAITHAVLRIPGL